MTKNKLEKLFSESARQTPTLWFMKLHNNPLAHQNTPADYILSRLFVDGFKVMLVECKLVTCEDGKGRLNVKRLKQVHDLLAFENFNPNFHRAYILIAFYDERWAKSELYMIPIKFIVETLGALQSGNIMSINRNYAKETFYPYRLVFINGSIDMAWS